MTRLLHPGKDKPERRSPEVAPWVEALRAASYRRVDTLSPADLTALLQGELDEEPLEASWNPEPPEGTWVNWFGDVWTDDDVPLDDEEPAQYDGPPYDPESAEGLPDYPSEDYGPQDPAGGTAGSREPPPPSYADGAPGYGPGNPLEPWPPGTLPPPSHGGPAVEWR